MKVIIFLLILLFSCTSMSDNKKPVLPKSYSVIYIENSRAGATNIKSFWLLEEYTGEINLCSITSGLGGVKKSCIKPKGDFEINVGNSGSLKYQMSPQLGKNGKSIIRVNKTNAKIVLCIKLATASCTEYN